MIGERARTMIGALDAEEEDEYEYEEDEDLDASVDSQAAPDDLVVESRKSVASARSSGGRSSARSSLMESEQLRTMQGESFVIVEVDKVIPVMDALIADCAALLNVTEGALLHALLACASDHEH